MIQYRKFTWAEGENGHGRSHTAGRLSGEDGSLVFSCVAGGSVELGVAGGMGCSVVVAGDDDDGGRYGAHGALAQGSDEAKNRAGPSTIERQVH